MQTQTFAKLCSSELCSPDSHSSSVKALWSRRGGNLHRVLKSLHDPFDAYPHSRIVSLSRLINFAVFPLSALCWRIQIERLQITSIFFLALAFTDLTELFSRGYILSFSVDAICLNRLFLNPNWGMKVLGHKRSTERGTFCIKKSNEKGEKGMNLRTAHANGRAGRDALI